jgi:hypothetical protein
MAESLVSAISRKTRLYEYQDHEGEAKEARHNLTDLDLKTLVAAARRKGGIAVPGVDAAQIRWASGDIRGAVRIDGIWFCGWFLSIKTGYEYASALNGGIDTTPSLKNVRLFAAYSYGLPQALRLSLSTLPA